MDDLAYEYVQLFNLISFTILFGVITLFKFLNENDRMSLLWRTIEVAIPDLLTFLVFFFIVFGGFVATGHILFGTELYDWQDFNHSFFTCFRMILGDFDYYSMSELGNRLLGPIYFLFYQILVFFILINMFLAIMNDSYRVVHDDIKSAPLGDAISKGITKHWSNFKGKFSAEQRKQMDQKKSKKIKKGRALRMLAEVHWDVDIQMDFEDFKREIDKWNPTDEQAQYLYDQVIELSHRVLVKQQQREEQAKKSGDIGSHVERLEKKLDMLLYR